MIAPASVVWLVAALVAVALGTAVFEVIAAAEVLLESPVPEYPEE